MFWGVGDKGCKGYFICEHSIYLNLSLDELYWNHVHFDETMPGWGTSTSKYLLEEALGRNFMTKAEGPR